jgi:hypothetical protein
VKYGRDNEIFGNKLLLDINKVSKENDEKKVDEKRKWDEL